MTTKNISHDRESFGKLQMILNHLNVRNSENMIHLKNIERIKLSENLRSKYMFV